MAVDFNAYEESKTAPTPPTGGGGVDFNAYEMSKPGYTPAPTVAPVAPSAPAQSIIDKIGNAAAPVTNFLSNPFKGLPSPNLSGLKPITLDSVKNEAYNLAKGTIKGVAGLTTGVALSAKNVAKNAVPLIKSTLGGAPLSPSQLSSLESKETIDWSKGGEIDPYKAGDENLPHKQVVSPQYTTSNAQNLGQEVEQGYGLGLQEVATASGLGGLEEDVTGVIGKSLADGLKSTFVKSLTGGGPAMAAYSAGSAMQDNQSAASVIKQAVQGYGTGVAAEIALGGAGALTKSFFDILGGKKTGSAAEQALSKEGEAMMPKSVPSFPPDDPPPPGSPARIVNKSDPNVSYIKSNDLGVTPAGDKMLSKVEIDAKTGKTTVTLDKSLDNNPAQKALVIDNAHDKIVAARTQPTLFENKTMLDKSMEDFAKVQGRSEADISASLNKEIKKFGSFQEARDAYKADPAATKVKAPTFSALMEHQTSPTTQIHTTSAVDIAKEAVDKMKAENPEPKENDNMVTSKVGQRIEEQAKEAGLKSESSNLATTEKIVRKAEVQKSKDFINDDYERAKEILNDRNKFPADQREPGFITAMNDIATEKGDWQTLDALKKSWLVQGTVHTAQNLGLLGELSDYSALKKGQEVENVIKKPNEKGIKNNIKNKVESAIKKPKLKINDWVSLVDSLRCK